VFRWVRVVQSLVFYVMLSLSLKVDPPLYILTVSLNNTNIWAHLPFEKSAVKCITNQCCQHQAINKIIVNETYIYLHKDYGGRSGRDRMVVGFTTAFAISAYYH
jgi:hypothetical protein